MQKSKYCINVCITYCTLLGWPPGGPSVLCRPEHVAHTHYCRWCHQCRTQAGGTSHTLMHTHTALSGHHRLPRMSSWHKPHLNGNKEEGAGLVFVYLQYLCFRFFFSTWAVMNTLPKHYILYTRCTVYVWQAGQWIKLIWKCISVHFCLILTHFVS